MSDKEFEGWLALSLKSEKPLSGPKIFSAGMVHGRKEMKAEIVKFLKKKAHTAERMTATELYNVAELIDKELP
jgi:hypothetical protein